MTTLVAQGLGGTGPVVVKPSEIALREWPTLQTLVDFDAESRRPFPTFDRDDRLLSLRDAKGGDLFTQAIPATVATQFVDWTDGQKGIGLASNRGVFVSTGSLVPASGSFTLFGLFTQAAGGDGFVLSNASTANRIAIGYLSTNQLRTQWGAAAIDPPTILNDGNPCSVFLSYDATAGRLRTFRNNVEVDDQAMASVPSQTDRRLAVGGQFNGTAVTGVIEGVVNAAGIILDAGDDGSALITMLKRWAAGRAPSRGWPTS